MFRTDKNNNPTAFTTAVAREAGLVEGVDYENGDPFDFNNSTYYTARLLGDPVAVTIKVIDKIGFYTTVPHSRWTYIAIPYELWMNLTTVQKMYVIGFMYQNEGGVDLKSDFPSTL
jgi:hypothetical protein